MLPYHQHYNLELTFNFINLKVIILFIKNGPYRKHGGLPIIKLKPPAPQNSSIIIKLNLVRLASSLPINCLLFNQLSIFIFFLNRLWLIS